MPEKDVEQAYFVINLPEAERGDDDYARFKQLAEMTAGSELPVHGEGSESLAYQPGNSVSNKVVKGGDGASLEKCEFEAEFFDVHVPSGGAPPVDFDFFVDRYTDPDKDVRRAHLERRPGWYGSGGMNRACVFSDMPPLTFFVTDDTEPAELEYCVPNTEFTGDTTMAYLLKHFYGPDATINPFVDNVRMLTDAYTIPSWCDDRSDPYAVETLFCIDEEQWTSVREGNLTHVIQLTEEEEPSHMKLGRRLRFRQRNQNLPNPGEESRCADDNGYLPYEGPEDFKDV